jgi:ABC-type nitrate/sulfonate/bicarbonate transport system substrate-binding protein
MSDQHCVRHSMMRRRATLRSSLLAAFLTGVAGLAAVQPTSAVDLKLTVMVFQGMQNLPLLAAQARGFFAGRGLSVDIKNAPNSVELREGLAQGRYQVVHSAVDNAIAMAEASNIDIAVVLGGDNGFNHLFAQSGIRSVEELRGKMVVVDAPDTAYALQLYRMLEQRGLEKGAYDIKPVGAGAKRLETMQRDRRAAAAMLNPPFSVLAARAGFTDLGTAVAAIGPYQGTAGYVRRDWAKANDDALVRYIAAYIEGLRWALDAANRREAVALIVSALRLSDDVAEQCLEIAAGPTDGLAKDAALDLAGFTNVLKLRAELLGQWGGTPPVADKYIELSYYRRALGTL